MSRIVIVTSLYHRHKPTDLIYTNSVCTSPETVLHYTDKPGDAV
jgi:hypothetical protein